MHTTATILESQCDWASATMPLGERAHALVLHVESLIASEQASGMSRHAYSIQGFSGVRCGRAAYALDKKLLLVQLSGQLGEEQLCTLLEYTQHITRLDLAVTARLDPCPPELAQETRDAFRSAHADDPQQPYHELRESSRGGATLYIGRRGKYRLLRLYNKEAERLEAHDPAGQRRYAGCWRWELESSGDLAARTALDYCATPDRVAFVRGVLWAALDQWRIWPPWDAGSVVSIRPGFSRRSDSARQIDWLTTHVAPVIVGLRQRGLGAAVDQALSGGLTAGGS